MFLKDFKEFAIKGNAIDLAVGVIIGGAFGKIVSSIVNDILMPVIGIFIGGINFSDLKFIIKPAQGNIPESAINYGNFIQAVVDFTIISFCIFLMVKAINQLRKKNEAPPADPVPTKEEILLTEIRDLLAKK
ncbi:MULTISPECIES: large-conductance mechanosensitive channel protein MscL [Cetobacterium]|jgi:large conductance mechanosensitive channel|uniref:Large-conductance mechanosensitive channel n=1 Tax=Candidatus Cetobacterium colombiensis TaxID=3073100 RepID=A0ABU4W6C5_9FUSO|nr:large-conductance mechanosensitive channel protein MscL [Candidatus Cetobacterium colombiensis]MDX8335072.1 large-conductance mechanosensitive channel protein MscL [Candidatus Cetobacterium colombiensis]